MKNRNSTPRLTGRIKAKFSLHNKLAPDKLQSLPSRDGAQAEHCQNKSSLQDWRFSTLLEFLLTVLCINFIITPACWAGELELGISEFYQNPYHPTPVGRYLSYYFPNQANFEASDMVRTHASLDWQEATNQILNFGFKNQWVWLRLNIRNDEKQQFRAYLTVENPVLDQIEFIQLDEDHQIQYEARTGDYLEFRERPIKTNSFSFPVSIPPNKRATILLAVKSSSSLQIPVSLKKFGELIEEHQNKNIFFGIFIGILLMMIASNSLIYLIMHQKKFLYYSLFVLCGAAVQAAVFGFTFQYFFFNHPYWQEKSIPVLTACMGLLGYYFILQYFPSYIKTGLSKKLLDWTQSLLLLNLLVTLFGAHTFAIQFTLVSVSVFGLLALFISIYVWRRGDLAGAHFFLAWLGLIGSTILLSLNKAGFLPRNFFTENSLKFGIIAEVIVLSFALSEQLRAERLKTSQIQLALQQKQRSTKRAKLIQEALISKPGERSDLDTEILYQAADNTGGDWCSVIRSDVLNRVFIFIGDVTGHGLPAAIVTGMVASAIRSGIERMESAPPYSRAEALRFLAGNINQLVYRTGSRSGRNMTMGFICIDLSSRCGSYLNAGHNEFYFLKLDTVRPLIRSGSILGFSDKPNFQIVDFQLEKGDILLGFTDGLIENIGPDGQQIQMKSLLKSFQPKARNPKELLQYISKTMEQTWSDTNYEDDVSVLAVQFN